MKVLSLFDGMSCGQIALKQLGIIPETYYASEIDKHAIKQTQLNFPDTIQLGDVIFLREAMCWKQSVADKLNNSLWVSDRTKSRFNFLRSIGWKLIDLVLAGSPCQGFSFAGKQLAFNDPRSKLFFEFIKILNHIKSLNPDVMFLLENVNMKKSHMRIISEYCGVYPVNINSNLVSAQNRDRWYWTNIRTKQVGLFGDVHSDIPQPEDKGIFLRDILEKEVDEKYYISQAVINRMLRKDYSKPVINPDKTGALNTKNNSGQMALDSGTTFISIDGRAPAQRSATGRSFDKKHNYQFIKLDIEGKVSKNQDKSSCFTAGGHSGGYHSDMDLIYVDTRGRDDFCLTPRRTEYGKSIRKDYEAGRVKEQRGNIQQLEPRSDGKTNCLTSVQKDNLILQRARGNNTGGFFEGKTPTLSTCAWEQNNLLCTKEVIQLNPSTDSGGTQPYQQDRVYDVNGISPALLADMSSGTHAILTEKLRRLIPIECSRLQTVPAWYAWACSDTQIYKMLGNGWTVDVIVHILSFINKEERKKLWIE